MEVCSADLVMLDRVFLQREKTALADVKRDVKGTIYVLATVEVVILLSS